MKGGVRRAMTPCSVRRTINRLALFSLFTPILYVSAANPVLRWDPNTEPSVLGYRVYDGPSSRNYTHVTDVGLQTSFPLDHIPAATTRYFAVTAYDTNRIESDLSEEIRFNPTVDGIQNGLVPFRLSNLAGLKTIQFSGSVGQHCYIVASSDLLDWQPIFSTTLSGTAPVTFVDPAAGQHPIRFYRVVGTPP